jgi:hypothetical protein
MSACDHITSAVATAQPTTPSAGMPSTGTPWISSADSGTFSASPATCSAITALGRDTALLKLR